jgi:ribonucleoside-diphosphate reductase alpha chain
MVILNVDHPDIVDFIGCKANEEKKAWTLVEAGYNGGFNVPGGAYDSISYQNANHSVRVTDEFMRAVLENKEWYTKAVKSGVMVDTYRARDLMKQIAEAAWICGDPGIQFDTTTNNWHTSPNSGRINASNPCSEFVFLDDSACNLASLNLLRFQREDGEFDTDAFLHAVSITVTAQEIIVSNASYPTPAIARNSQDFRPLGLGYANLGALLMSRGYPYDSDEGRDYAGAITAIMSGQAYKTSAIIASEKGPFRGFEVNRESMLGVIQKHRLYVDKINPENVPATLIETAKKLWDDAYTYGKQFGFRNAQTSVLAPTGTIAFMMDCDTTGVEPDIALVKYKKLVGGGFMKIVNNTVPLALKKLGYDDEQVEQIVSYIDKNDMIEGAPYLNEAHLPVFDCAFRTIRGKRTIHYMGHIKMMASVQPFISGAISKTVNMPNEVTPDEIMQAYIEAWKLGLKAIAVYRDECKRTQPLNTSLKAAQKFGDGKGDDLKKFKAVRRRLPDERRSITHKFSIAGHEGYITVGMYEDGQPGEIFIVMAKEGTVVSGLMDSFATAISLAFQYGVPLRVLVDKFVHTRFEPSGFTNNRDIPIAKSVCDYIFRWLALKFMPNDDQPSSAILKESEDAMYSSPKTDQGPEMLEGVERNEHRVFITQADAPPCPECGSIMVRNGSCYKCLECGSTSGCS